MKNNNVWEEALLKAGAEKTKLYETTAAAQKVCEEVCVLGTGLPLAAVVRIFIGIKLIYSG